MDEHLKQLLNIMGGTDQAALSAVAPPVAVYRPPHPAAAPELSAPAPLNLHPQVEARTAPRRLDTYTTVAIGNKVVERIIPVPSYSARESVKPATRSSFGFGRRIVALAGVATPVAVVALLASNALPKHTESNRSLGHKEAVATAPANTITQSVPTPLESVKKSNTSVITKPSPAPARHTRRPLNAKPRTDASLEKQQALPDRFIAATNHTATGAAALPIMNTAHSPAAVSHPKAPTPTKHHHAPANIPKTIPFSGGATPAVNLTKKITKQRPHKR